MYSRELSTPATTREGLANAVQLIINLIESGENNEALLSAVNLLDDVRSNANPYNIDTKAKRKRKEDNYRGTVNVD
jgi:hypothetical protein